MPTLIPLARLSLTPHHPYPCCLSESFSLPISLIRPLHLPVFSLSYQSASRSLSEARNSSLFSLPCPHYVLICVTHEAWTLVKNNRWNGNRRIQGERWGGGDWWLGKRIWREEERGPASEAESFKTKLRNPSINSWCFDSASFLLFGFE